MEADIVVQEDSLILNKKIVCRNSFSEKMILNADIPGVIKPIVKHFNNSEYYTYNLSNKKSLKRIYEDKEISEDEVINIFTELANIRIRLSEYLLNYSYLLINPEYIYFDIAEGNLYFCLVPEANESLMDDFGEFAIFLMDRIDNECEQTVGLVYKYYDKVLNGVFDPGCVLSEYEKNNGKDIEIDHKLLNQIEDKEKYYFIEPVDKELEETETILLKPLIVCAITILLVGGIYAVVFLNPHILRIIGLSQENYFVIGAALAFLMSLVLFFIIKMYIKKAEKEEIIKAEKEDLLHQESMRAGTMELIEFNMKNSK